MRKAGGAADPALQSQRCAAHAARHNRCCRMLQAILRCDAVYNACRVPLFAQGRPCGLRRSIYRLELGGDWRIERFRTGGTARALLASTAASVDPPRCSQAARAHRRSAFAYIYAVATAVHWCPPLCSPPAPAPHMAPPASPCRRPRRPHLSAMPGRVPSAPSRTTPAWPARPMAAVAAQAVSAVQSLRRRWPDRRSFRPPAHSIPRSVGKHRLSHTVARTALTWYS